MRAILRLGFLVLLVLVVGSVRAEAGFWDWLEELNGPGPSVGRSLPLMVSFFCKPYSAESGEKQSTGKKLFRAAFEIPAQTERQPAPGSVQTCLYYDTHSFHAEDDVRFYPVDSRLWEFGVSTKLHPTIEIGGGLGGFSFSSRLPDSSGGGELSGERFAVTFPRVVFKPLLALPLPTKKYRALGLLQLYFKHTIIVGTLADEDFASKEGTDFIRTNQRVESVGFTIDLTVVGNIVFDALKKN